MTLTFEDRVREMTALLDAGLRISRYQDISVADRLDAIGRLLGRIEGHRAAALFLVEVAGSLRVGPADTPNPDEWDDVPDVPGDEVAGSVS